jgi:hypothetical protein
MILRTQPHITKTKSGSGQINYMLLIFYKPEQRKYRMYNTKVYTRYLNKDVYNTAEKMINYIKREFIYYEIDTFDFRDNYFNEELREYYKKST